MPSRKGPLVGTWRIEAMELWDRDYLDLEGEAHITFDRDRLGSFQFGAVRGGIDYRLSHDQAATRVEFSWEGFNDSDPSSGRGWAVHVGDRLEGRFYFHNGDDSAFVATRAQSARRASASSRLDV
jgi:hypothetical protein